MNKSTSSGDVALRPASSSDQVAGASGLTSGEIEALAELARQAAQIGGKELTRYFGHLEHVRDKGRCGDLVTEADHAAEAAVLAFLEEKTPAIGVLAEESGRRSKPGDLEWCIDPLDGTTNYAHGFPFFGTSVGLCWRDQPLLGALAAPGLDQLFWAAPGLGAWCNNGRLQVSDCPSLDRALLVTGFAYDRHTRLDNNYAEFAWFSHRTQGVRRSGSVAMDLAYVAAGKLDGIWERGLSPWDVAAGLVMVEQAGGVVSDYDGGSLLLNSGRILACSPALQAPLIEGLAACRPLTGASYGAPELDP